MTLDPFDEGLEHRSIVPCSPAYGEVFFKVQAFVRAHLPGIELVHIGSNSQVHNREMEAAIEEIEAQISTR